MLTYIIMYIILFSRKNMSPRHQFADFECIYGSPYIYETLLGYVFRISAASFFQLNTGGASVLYDTVREMAGFTKNTVLLDVCCGTGMVALGCWLWVLGWWLYSGGGVWALGCWLWDLGCWLWAPGCWL